MSNPFIIAGLACLIGAIVGGGLKAFGIEVPALAAWWRQVALGILGVALLVFGSRNLSNPPAAEIPTPTLPIAQTSEPQGTKLAVQERALAGPILLSWNADPMNVAPGGSTEITVFATASNNSVVPDARVAVAAGGGLFPETGTTKVVGTTDEKGVFHTRWHTASAEAYTNLPSYSYLIDVSVVKNGMEDGRAEIKVNVVH